MRPAEAVGTQVNRVEMGLRRGRMSAGHEIGAEPDIAQGPATLDGRVAIVTGSSAGIGEAIARELARARS